MFQGGYMNTIAPKVDDNTVTVRDSCNCCRPSSCMSCFGHKHKQHKHKTKQTANIQQVWDNVNK